MDQVIKLLSKYVSTSSFLLLSALIIMFSDSFTYIQELLDYLLPVNGRFLAFTTFLGLILMYEIYHKKNKYNARGCEEIKSHIKELQLVVEKSSLISDVNSAFTEFRSSGREHITGEYYIKEIMTLNDTRAKLGVNSYTQNKLDYLLSKIKH